MSLWDMMQCSEKDKNQHYLATQLFDSFRLAKKRIDDELDELKEEFFHVFTDYYLEEVEEEIDKQHPSYVYFLKAEGLNQIKIGKANNIQARINQLQTGLPYELKLLYAMKFDNSSDAYRAEQWFHKKFKDARILIGESNNRKKTEWFNLEMKKLDDPSEMERIRDVLVDMFRHEDEKQEKEQRRICEILERNLNG